MTEILICLGGIFIILQVGEYLWRHKILKGEYLRKAIHIPSACFIASWPWLISWIWIQIIGVAMLSVVVLNHQRRTFHIDGNIERHTYGGILFAVAVILCAALTHRPIFFALAMLHLGLADGLAAVVGEYFKKMRYKVWGYTKSVYGSMAFWLISLCIFSISSLYISDLINFGQYGLMLLLLPPLLTLLENVSVKGFDNVTVPVAVILALSLLS